MFNARGFAGARMDDIAAAAGISKAALYLQFPTKQALFEEVVGQLIAATLPLAMPADFGDAAAAPLLRSFITAMAERITSAEMAFVPRVIIGEGANFPDLARFYHDHVITKGLGMVEAIIAHGVSRGEFTCADPHLACRTVMGGLLITALWRMVFEPVGGEQIDPAAFAAVHADTLINGLCGRTETP